MKNKIIFDLKENKKEKPTDFMSTWLAAHRVYGKEKIDLAKSIPMCWEIYTKQVYKFYLNAKKNNWFPNLEIKFNTKSFKGPNSPTNHRYSKAWVMFIVENKLDLNKTIEYCKNYESLKF